MDAGLLCTRGAPPGRDTPGALRSVPCPFPTRGAGWESEARRKMDLAPLGPAGGWGGRGGTRGARRAPRIAARTRRSALWGSRARPRAGGFRHLRLGAERHPHPTGRTGHPGQRNPTEREFFPPGVSLKSARSEKRQAPSFLSFLPSFLFFFFLFFPSFFFFFSSFSYLFLLLLNFYFFFFSIYFNLFLFWPLPARQQTPLSLGSGAGDSTALSSPRHPFLSPAASDLVLSYRTRRRVALQSLCPQHCSVKRTVSAVPPSPLPVPCSGSRPLLQQERNFGGKLWVSSSPASPCPCTGVLQVFNLY